MNSSPRRTLITEPDLLQEVGRFCANYRRCSVRGAKFMPAGNSSEVFHLRVAAEPDPSVLARILERFQNLNVVPRRVLAEWATTGTLHVEIEVSGISEDMLSLIAAKLGQVPSILDARWHR